jgi:ketosteroid isomerase-like protein
MTGESTTSDLVRRARQGYEAASRDDLDAVMSLYAADAVYDLSDLGLETFEGAEAIRGFQEDWFRSWEEYRFEVEELLDFGHGVVLSVIREGGRLRGGSGRVEHRVAHLRHVCERRDRVAQGLHRPGRGPCRRGTPSAGAG